MAAAPDFAVDESLLPPQARRLVRGIGFPATLKLLRARGGTRIRMPRRGENSQLLVDLVGTEAADQVVKLFPDQEFVLLPKCDKLVAQMRDAEIRARRPHMTLQALALEYDLTIRWIIAITGEVPAANEPQNQGDLFG
jgi:hypothetical protein